MKIHKSIVALAVICLLPVMASAEWARTVTAWDTLLPAQGKIQLSVWSGYYKSEQSNIDKTEKGAYLDMVYGLSDKWSVGVSPFFYGWKKDGGGSESGISDTSLMTTYRFRDEATGGLDLAVMGVFNLPTGNEDKDLGSGKVEPEVKLLAAKKYGPIIAVANLGVTTVLNADKGYKDVMFQPSLEGVYPLNDRLSLNAAFTGSTASSDTMDGWVDMAVGAMFKPREDMFVAGSVTTCVTSSCDWNGIELSAGIQF